MIDNLESKKKRTEMLMEMRKEHRETVQKAQELLKAQQSARKALERTLQGAPHTVPQLAKATGLPAHEVLWYVASMKKYGLLAEAGTDESGDYYFYRLIKESQV
jgi:predicted transcriptional regulator